MNATAMRAVAAGVAAIGFVAVAAVPALADVPPIQDPRNYPQPSCVLSADPKDVTGTVNFQCEPYTAPDGTYINAIRVFSPL